MVHNPYGSSTSAPAQIQVFVPPKITAAPQNAYLRAGQSGALTVGVTGTAPLVYTWRRAGSVVAILTNNPTWSFPEVSEAVVGTYTVTVANFAGAVTAPPASVAIVIPVAIQSQPEGTNSIGGLTLALRVGVTGDAPITYQWRRNGQEVLNATNAFLEFSSLSGADEGTYTVLVRNPVATVLSLPTSLSFTLRTAPDHPPAS